MNNCYLEHKEAINNLKADITKTNYEDVKLGRFVNEKAFKEHNDKIKVQVVKIKKVVDKWNEALTRLNIQGNVVKRITKPFLGDGDSKVSFARNIIDIVYDEEVLSKLDNFRKSLGIYDSKLSYSSYLENKKAEQESLKTNVKTLTEPLTLHKGLGGKFDTSGNRINVHYGVKGRFFSTDYNIAKEYDKGKGIITEILPIGTTIERIDVRKDVEYVDDLRPAEIEAINNSKADIVELGTFDGDGEVVQYIIKDVSSNLFENERLNAAKEINKELLQSSKGRSADRLQSAKISSMETELNKEFFSTNTAYQERALSETEKTTKDAIFEVDSNNSILYAIRQKLSDPNSFNGRLFAKLNSLAKIKVIITDSKDDIYVVGNDLYINLEGFSKSLAESDGENYLEAILFEELIHIASNRIVPKNKEQSIINAQIKADPNFVNKVNQSYVTDNKRQAYFEYIRIKVQEAVTSTTTLKERMTWSDQLLGVYKELLDIIYSIIQTKTTKKLIKEHIEFVEDAIKEQRAFSIKPASSELKDYFKSVKQTPEITRLISEIDKILPQYPAYDINSLVGLLIEVPEFTQDLQNSFGTRFPYVNLHKELSTVLLQAKGVIPNTEAYYKAMEMFGYRNKPFIFVEELTPIENNGQLVEYSKMAELIQELTTGEIPNNTSVLRPDFRLYFNPPLLFKRAKIPVQDTQGYVAIFDSIQERLGKRTLTELRDSGEFNRMEWGGILLYALEQALRLELPINIQTIQKVKDFLEGNNRLNESISPLASTTDFRHNSTTSSYTREFVSTNAGVFKLNIPGSSNNRLQSDQTVDGLPKNNYATIADALQKRIGARTFNEIWASREFNDMERKQFLLSSLRNRLTDKNSFNGRLFEKLKNQLGENLRVDIDSKYDAAISVKGSNISINMELFSQGLVELEKGINIDRQIDLILSEELIHVVSNILRTPNEYTSLFITQFMYADEFKNNLSEVYRSFKNLVTEKNEIVLSPYQAPMEFFRMGVQDYFFKQVTEMSAYSLQDFYQALLKGLKYLRDVFVEPTNKKLIDEHIAYIEDALREINVVSYETLMQYNTTPEIWEVAESVEQFDKFKKNYTQPENTEELIKDFKEFAQLEQSNINLECL